MGSYTPKIDQSVGEDDSPIPAIKHFHPGVCGTCYKAPVDNSPLLRCSQCQLISYCSRACQKKDWPTHKFICLVNKAKDNCNVFSSFKNRKKEEEDGERENENENIGWYQFCSNLSLACSVNLKRPLTVREKEMFWYPKVCEICKDSKVPLLKECEKCHSVFYCSDEHRDTDKDHGSWCSLLNHGLQCDSIEAKEGIQDLPFPTIVDDDYKEMATTTLKDFLEPQLTVDPSKTLDNRFVTMIGERLSFPLSFQYAIEKLDRLSAEANSLFSLNSLKIHVIGAESSVELLGIIRWEYLLHRLPSVKRLHVTFIGPNLLKTEEAEDELLLEKHCIDDTGSTRCSDCTEKNRIVVYEMAAMFYHQYEESRFFRQPDAIVAFNCGFHEHEDQPTDTWKESLKLIANTDAPLIFTSYTKTEAQKDLKVIEKICGPIIVKLKPHINPYHSPRPFRDPVKEDGNPIYYYNQYLTCICRKSP